MLVLKTDISKQTSGVGERAGGDGDGRQSLDERLAQPRQPTLVQRVQQLHIDPV